MAGQIIIADLLGDLRAKCRVVDHEFLPQTICQCDQAPRDELDIDIDASLCRGHPYEILYVVEVLGLELPVDGMNFGIAARLVPQAKPGERMVFADDKWIMDNLDIGIQASHGVAVARANGLIERRQERISKLLIGGHKQRALTAEIVPDQTM